jgi:acyl carrier protein
MREEVVAAIQQAVRRTTVTEETRLSEIAWDSLETVEVLAVLNSRFQVPIEPHQMEGIRTVGGLVDYTLANLGSESGRDPLLTF